MSEKKAEEKSVQQLERTLDPNNVITNIFFSHFRKLLPATLKWGMTFAANFTSQEVARIREGVTTTCEKEEDVLKVNTFMSSLVSRESTHMH